MTLHNKSKARHPMSRRTLRQRKIQSVKRQIQIKEKMLEVGNLFQLKNISNLLSQMRII